MANFNSNSHIRDLEFLLMLVIEGYDREDYEDQAVQMFARDHIIILYENALSNALERKPSEAEKKIRDFFDIN